MEAATIVLAAGASGWAPALAGAAAATLALASVLAVAGAWLSAVSILPIRIVCGSLLLMIGLRWLRKSTLRAAGRISSRDETTALRRHTLRLAGSDAQAGFAAAFGAVAVEGFEVVLITVSVARDRALAVPAYAGAVVMFGVVVAAVAIYRAPLTRVPQNTLKRVAGVLLTSYGTMWLIQAAGFHFPIIIPIAAFTVITLAAGRHADRSPA